MRTRALASSSVVVVVAVAVAALSLLLLPAVAPADGSPAGDDAYAAAIAARFGLGEGLAPVDVGAAGEDVSPRACGECHARAFAEWSSSRHHDSATNALFVDGFADEPHSRCVYCHAPERAASSELLQARRVVARTRHLVVDDGAALHGGVSCATCHVRDGAILTDDPAARPYGHPLRTSTELGDPAFCAACHDFVAHETVDGETRLMRAPLQRMQSTWREWLQYQRAGGSGTCQSCHMPGGAHTFRGAHDVELLRRSIALEVVGARVRVTSIDVGHSFPTGDLFRHLVLWAEDAHGARTALYRFGRRFALRPGDDGHLHKVQVEDTSLQPGVPVVVDVPRGTRLLEVTYHYADDKTELRGTLPLDELLVSIARLTPSPF